MTDDERLRQAENALHALNMGKAKTTVKFGDRRVHYTPADSVELQRYIGELRSTLPTMKNDGPDFDWLRRQYRGFGPMIVNAIDDAEREYYSELAAEVEAELAASVISIGTFDNRQRLRRYFENRELVKAAEAGGIGPATARAINSRPELAPWYGVDDPHRPWPTWLRILLCIAIAASVFGTFAGVRWFLGALL